MYACKMIGWSVGFTFSLIIFQNVMYLPFLLVKKCHFYILNKDYIHIAIYSFD